MKQKNKTVLITGCGSGFGKSTAITMAKKGYHVIATFETPSQIHAFKQELGGEKLPISFYKLNICDENDRQLVQDWDIDILLNNGAVSEGGAVVDLPEEILRKQFEVNVFGTILLTQLVARKMIKKKSGKIVFISSVAGITTDPFAGAYSATKHAIEAFAAALNAELMEFGIPVATINPGPIYTGFNDRMFEGPLNWSLSDKENALFDYSKIAFPHEQFAPEQVINKIVKILEGSIDLYRNIVPDELVTQTKKQMDDVWNQKQTRVKKRHKLVEKAYKIQPETINGK